MGVLGLQNFINKRCPDARIECNIVTEANKYRKKTGKTPELVIDGSNCCRFMYYKTFPFLPCGSNSHKIAGEFFMQFLQRLTDADIKFIVYWDGAPPDDRVEIVRRRKNEKLVKLKKIYQCLFEETELPNDLDQTVSFGTYRLYLESLLLFQKVPTMVTVREADDMMLEYMKDGAFGVLSDDSDFIIPREIENTFSVTSLDPLSLDTIRYDRQRLADCLHLKAWQLPFFVTLCGNDIITRHSLRQFHEEFLKENIRYSYHVEQDYLSSVVIFPLIARWLKRILDGNEGRSDLPEYLASLVGLSDLEKDFRRSVLSYKPSFKNSICTETAMNNMIADTNDETATEWTWLVKLAEKRAENGLLRSSNYSIMTKRRFCEGLEFQIYDDETYPCGSILLEDVYRRLFGVLLKEHPGEADAQTVKIYGHRHDEYPYFANVVAVLPSEHPGLATLWSDDCPSELKWSMLCWIVNPALQATDVLEMPQELRIPAMAIYFLYCTWANMIEDYQMEALVVTAVKMLSVAKHELMPSCPWKDPVALHWASVYQEICRVFYSASGACGNPSHIFQHPHYFFFDSEVYHVYHAIQDGLKEPRQLCSQNNQLIAAYDSVKIFLRKYKH